MSRRAERAFVVAGMSTNDESPTHPVPFDSLSTSLASLSLNTSELPLPDVHLVADTVREIRELLNDTTALLITGLDRPSRRRAVTLAIPNAQFLSASVFATNPTHAAANLTSSDDQSSFLASSISSSLTPPPPIVIDDLDLPDNRHAEPVLCSLFTSALLSNRLIIATASSRHVVPSAMLRADRLARHFVLSPANISARSAFWYQILSNSPNYVSPVSSQPHKDSQSKLAHALSAATPPLSSHTLNLLAARVLSQDGLSAAETPSFVRNLSSASTPITAKLPSFVTELSPEKKNGECTTEAGKQTCADNSEHCGYSDTRKRLQQLVGWPLHHASTFQRLGARPPRGVLLHGPPGCGKTTLARAILADTSADLSGMYIHCAQLFAGYLGESERRVRELFAAARAAAPAVIVLDALDVAATPRAAAGNDSGGTGVENRVLGALLAEMDGVEQAGVFVIGCVRDPTDLDAAIVRPGRLDHFVDVPLPNCDDRKEIFSHFLQCTAVEGGEEGKRAVVLLMAEQTEGFSGADLRKLAREAGLLAMEKEGEPDFVPASCYSEALEELNASIEIQ